MPLSAVWLVILLGAALLVPVPSTARTLPDDGMWTFDNLPRKVLKEKYGFEPTQEWLDHVRMSSARVSTGGSSSFVSPRGLVMTNHHVALELVNKLSSTENDFVKNGFHARTLAEELKCPGAEIRQLRSITDVTAMVESAVAGAKDARAAAAARAVAIERIAAEESARTDLTVDVVTLYGGGQYMAYGYKLFNDVRLVFAPEMRIAYFGGDDDNFCYPRYCLDCAFLRVYEDGKPADTSAHYFKWSKKGPAENELVFVSGHPGDTGRLLPISSIRYERDTYNPVLIAFLKSQEKALVTYSARGDKERLEVLDELFGVRNSIKAYEGHQAGLLDPEVMRIKEAEEARFRASTKDDAEATAALARMEEVAAGRKEAFPLLICGRFQGELVELARSVNRLAEMAGRPESERPEPLRGDMFAAAVEDLCMDKPIDMSRQSDQIAAVLELGERFLGRNHPMLATVLGDSLTPADAAARLLKSTNVLDSAWRRSILTPNDSAAAAVSDPLIEFLNNAQKLRTAALQRYQKLEEEEQELLVKIAKARFRAFGTESYPDATFTLRLSFGTVLGYELGTTRVPAKTTLFGLFARSAEFDNKAPFDLPPSWSAVKDQLELETPFNFVSTCDIIGGNSGSPVINKDAEIVGLIFDGNIQSLSNRYLYDERQGRSVSVHSQGIVHALERVYRAYGLLAELGVR